LNFTHTIPAEIRQGDTATWTAETPDHSAADGWALKYAIVSPVGQKVVLGTATATAWEMILTATLSASYPTGALRWVAYSEKGTGETRERITHESGPITFLPDLANATAGFDTRTTAAKLLEAVEDVLLNQAASAHAEKSVSTSSGSMALKYVPRAELLTMRDRLRAEVEAERQLENLNRGLGGSRRIVARIMGAR
jgi:hypothetical protein